MPNMHDCVRNSQGTIASLQLSLSQAEANLQTAVEARNLVEKGAAESRRMAEEAIDSKQADLDGFIAAKKSHAKALDSLREELSEARRQLQTRSGGQQAPPPPPHRPTPPDSTSQQTDPSSKSHLLGAPQTASGWGAA